MRSHIAKNLQKRTSAIRKAVAKHNLAAAKIGKPTFDWSQITQYTFIDEFSILRKSRHDIAPKMWVRTFVRDAMRLHLRIQRAREEIVRCNLEARRLHTFIKDEHHHHDTIIAELTERKSTMLHFVSEHINRRQGVNHEILRRIHQIYKTPGYTGDPTPGTVKTTSIRPGVASAEEVMAGGQTMAGVVLQSKGYNSDSSSNDPADDNDAQDAVSGVYDFYT